MTKFHNHTITMVCKREVKLLYKRWNAITQPLQTETTNARIRERGIKLNIYKLPLRCPSRTSFNPRHGLEPCVFSQSNPTPRKPLGYPCSASHECLRRLLTTTSASSFPTAELTVTANFGPQRPFGAVLGVIWII